MNAIKRCFWRINVTDKNSLHDVFISYSRKNRDAVLPIKECLESQGFSCWMDLEGIESGSREFSEHIINAIDASSAMLFFLSAESQESEWALKEIDYATDEHKHVVIVRFNDDQMTKKFRFEFKRADIIDWRLPEQRGKLLRDLKLWSGNGEPPQGSRSGTGPSFVVCPVCGKKNRAEDASKCSACGHDLPRLHHQDATASLSAERRAREIREASLRNGTCLETGICRTLTLPGGAEMEMIYCPPGEFMIGSPTTEEGRFDFTETQHRVRLTKGFWLGKYPVTQKQWKSVMGNNPSHFKKALFLTDAARPVECVSWVDCQKFIKMVNAEVHCGARLPTEAEWEYACRAGTTTAYFWGNALNGDKANCNGKNPCGTKAKGPFLCKTTPVGRYAPNPWGFHDMHGNVEEWCNDYWTGSYPTGSVTDPVGPASGDGRVLRGGCWRDSAKSCRSAARSWGLPDGYCYGYYDCGFRLCCSAGPRG